MIRKMASCPSPRRNSRNAPISSSQIFRRTSILALAERRSFANNRSSASGLPFHPSAGRQRNLTRRSNVIKLDNPVLQVLENYKAAVYAKDVDAFIALYDEDVVVFDMWGVWSYNGIASWRDMVARWFGSLGTERVIVDFSHVRTVAVQDLAVVHAFVRYRAVSEDGVDLRALDNRLSVALRNKDGGWKIVHEHTSSPLDFETAKVMFNR